MPQLDQPRLAPHNLDAEQAVLGSCLLDRDAIVRLAPHLDPEDFFRIEHASIWRAMVALYQRREPIDILLLASELRRSGALQTLETGEAYLAELVGATPTAVHVDYYAGRVRETAIRRRLARSANEIATVAYNEALPLSEVITRADEALHDAARIRTREGFRTMAEIVQEAYETLDRVEEPGLALGLSDLDQLLGGVRRGQLVLPAARPSVGKSAMAIQAGVHIARRGDAVGIISLEMTVEEILDRIAGFTVGVNMHAVRNGQARPDDLPRVMTMMGKLADLPLLIDDRSNGTLSDVLARARMMFAERGISVLIVDYIQLISIQGDGGKRRPGNRTEEVSMVSRALKTLARELNMTVIALSQLSRASETRSDPTPQLSDLRESGSLEQDADIVVFIHRPDRYHDNAERNVAHMIVAKHRNGPIGMVKMRFQPEHSQFVSYRWSEAV